MTTASKIFKGVEARLLSLHIAPASDGSDVGIINTAIEKATGTVLAASGFDAIPDELICAVADLAAADCAEYIMSSAASSGDISSKSDGKYSVKYKDGTSRNEKLFGLIQAMRESGISAMNTFRRLRW